jgi:hypothetical protein
MSFIIPMNRRGKSFSNALLNRYCRGIILFTVAMMMCRAYEQFKVFKIIISKVKVGLILAIIFLSVKMVKFTKDVAGTVKVLIRLVGIVLHTVHVHERFLFSFILTTNRVYRYMHHRQFYCSITEPTSVRCCSIMDQLWYRTWTCLARSLYCYSSTDATSGLH